MKFRSAGAVTVALALASVSPTGAMADFTGPEPAQVFVDIADKAMPAVVNIFTTQKISSQGRGQMRRWGGTPEEFWREFYGERLSEPHESDITQPLSLGSGFVVEASSDEALILTNDHVIRGAHEVKVKFTESSSEKETVAEVIGRDPELDVALLKAKIGQRVQALPLGDSDSLRVGEWIAAIGNPFGHGHSLSHGILSAKERALPGGFGKHLQVDAPINPGNSGGPLMNMRGEVVGINVAIDARGPGIGFAIPANSVKRILAQLKDNGKVARGYLGLQAGELNEQTRQQLGLSDKTDGSLVVHVQPGSAAFKSGIREYDVIVEVDGRTVPSPSELVNIIAGASAGQKVEVKFIRGAKLESRKVELLERPVEFVDSGSIRNRSR